MPEKKELTEKETARTSVLSTEKDKADYSDYCRSIGCTVSSRLRDFMRADMEDWRRENGR